MTLLKAILKKVKSKDSLKSPPPDVDVDISKKSANSYSYVSPKVDSHPPLYSPAHLLYNMGVWKSALRNICAENTRLVMAIRKTQHSRGRVDSRRSVSPPPDKQKYQERADFLKRIQRDNRSLYKIITTTGPRVASTASLKRDWRRNRRVILDRAQAKFVLFPPVPRPLAEDPAFHPPPGVKRPRVYLNLRIERCAKIGDLVLELLTDICPITCQLFMDLLDGDGVGYGYVGTHFFRKVPGLYWSGGDVVHDNGFGCYAQRGLQRPIGAENYHFSHSMPGLVSMRMTPDDEMCGIFNITFKPLPQFDLKNVVFARVIRPSIVFDSICGIGSALSSKPVVEICGARRRVGSHWVHGKDNTKMILPFKRQRKTA